jgi:hypothetical protein
MPQHPADRPTRTDTVPGPPPQRRPPARTGGAPGRRQPTGPQTHRANLPPGPGSTWPDAVSGAITAPDPAPAKARDLTVNKVLAGAGAAATSAVLGSFFGAAGTVAGAALGSVASTVAATFYQRYLDRTRDTIVARIRPVAGGTSPSELTLPMQRGPQDETVCMRVEPALPLAPPRRRRWWAWVGATVLIFAIGLLAVTGFEWVKGSTLTSNGSGTSVGRVIGGDGGPSTPTTAPSAPGDTSTPEPTTEPSSSADPDGNSTGSTDPSTPSSEAPSTGNASEATNVPRLPNLPDVGSGG